MKWRLKAKDGTKVGSFTVVVVKDVAMVMPKLDNGKLVMVRQFKPGAGEVTLEFPAGRKDKAEEDYEETAERELLEETGLKVRELIPIGETVTFPTKGSERVMNFVGKGAYYVGEQNLDKHERIEIVELEPMEVVEKIKSGEINTAPTIACWQLAKIKLGEWWD